MVKYGSTDFPLSRGINFGKSNVSLKILIFDVLLFLGHCHSPLGLPENYITHHHVEEQSHSDKETKLKRCDNDDDDKDVRGGFLTRPCVNRVVPPPTHLSRHS